MGTPEVLSHSLTLLSTDPKANREPSGENDKAITPLGQPLKVAMSAPVVPSHNLTVLSFDPEASREPSGENDTTLTTSE